MQIPENVKSIGRRAKRIIHWTVLIIGGGVITALLGAWIYTSNLPAPTEKQIAIHHEFLEQASELDHRTKVCSEMVDSFNPSPDYQNAAGFHCGMMWVQVKRFEAFVGQMHIQDPDTRPLIEQAFRTAAKYAEYQTAINKPRFHPSQPQD